MSVKERLKIFAKSKERSVRAFEFAVGLNPGYINSIRVSIQPDKLQRIASKYPDLNRDWLITGEGDMLIKDIADSNNFSDISNDNPNIPPLNQDDMNRILLEMTGIISRQEENISKLIEELKNNGHRSDRMLNIIEQERGIAGDRSLKKTGSE